MSLPPEVLEALALRFGDAPEDLEIAPASASAVHALAMHRSHRRYRPAPVDPRLVRILSALALCAPSKSDLQQRDIVIVEDPLVRAEIDRLLASSAWVREAPALLVFCADNRRQRQIHDWRGRPFANDHLDAFFNASVDAGIALAAFIVAAESVGLGCCPLSAIRNHSDAVSDLLGLPERVFPVAGLTLGWPAEEGEISLRLPLAATVHVDRYDDDGQRDAIAAYDARRSAVQPYARQRRAAEFGEDPDYGWSEDKARQYSEVQRADFGRFIRGKGFDLS